MVALARSTRREKTNMGSIRVAEKLGYRTMEERTYRDKPVVILARS